jgi:NAD+ kinase
MKIGIHGKEFDEQSAIIIAQLLQYIAAKDAEIFLSDGFDSILKDSSVAFSNYKVYNTDTLYALDAIITLGGDGTLLDVVSQIGALETPILGINMGRLGFLATTAKEDVIQAVDLLFEGNYEIDERTLLRLETKNNVFGQKNFALNDVTVLKKDTASMIVVHTYINGDFLNSYWADGLIISTPTGSTGYSLSCGGPLVLPQSNNTVLTPVSPHNLTARPMVLADDSEITLKIEGRSDTFLLSLDSRHETVEAGIELTVVKEKFVAKLIKLPNNQIFDTLRQKLHWGIDIRN